MRTVFTTFLILLHLNLGAQVILISFAGTGASESVGSVKVENFSSGASFLMDGSDILRLNVTSDVNSPINPSPFTVSVYPNPVTESSTVRVVTSDDDAFSISLVDLRGQILSWCEDMQCGNNYQLQIPGNVSGLYFLNVKGKRNQQIIKLVSNTSLPKKIEIEIIDDKNGGFVNQSLKDTKGFQNYFDIPYVPGERLSFTGIAGEMRTIVTDIPDESKTISFHFAACRDGDNNTYPIVKIGDQLWMAENLKTTRYNDGVTTIPCVTGDYPWSILKTPAYCWYNNNEAQYKDLYGALYNWFSVQTGKLCPSGWKLPSDNDWVKLTNYLGGVTIAGAKLKEVGSKHWSSPITGVTNETGFTALPSGNRWGGGIFSTIGGHCYWWTTTACLSTSSYYRLIYNNPNSVLRGDRENTCGFSVRCLRDLR